MKRRDKIISNILISLGACLILGGALLYGFNTREGNRAYAKSIDQVEKVKDEISRRMETAPSEEKAEWDPDSKEKIVEGLHSLPEAKALSVVEIDGYPYDGYLEIPAIDLEMPVVDECNESNLKYFLCRFDGDPYAGDMIIAGHNYKKVFRKIRDLKEGDQILFTTMDGEQFLYEVSEVEIITGTDTEQMLKGDWDLTLFTCTFGGKERYTVRCVRVVQAT